MSELSTTERADLEVRIKAHNYSVLTRLQAELAPLEAQLNAVETLARDIVVMQGDEVMRIRDILVGNIATLKSAMAYHVTNTIQGAIDQNAPAAPEA